MRRVTLFRGGVRGRRLRQWHWQWHTAHHFRHLPLLRLNHLTTAPSGLGAFLFRHLTVSPTTCIPAT
jgi:hypothetical protein